MEIKDEQAFEFLKEAFIEFQKKEDPNYKFVSCDLHFFEPYFERVQTEELYNDLFEVTSKIVYRVKNRYISIIHNYNSNSNNYKCSYDFSSVKFATKKTITIDIFD